MAVYGKHVADMKFGIRIGWDTGKKEEKWYGSNQEKRNRKHNQYVETDGVLFVQNIEAPK